MSTTPGIRPSGSKSPPPNARSKRSKNTAQGATQEAPLLTHRIRHHGQITLLAPDSQGKVRQSPERPSTRAKGKKKQQRPITPKPSSSAPHLPLPTGATQLTVDYSIPSRPRLRQAVSNDDRPLLEPGRSTGRAINASSRPLSQASRRPLLELSSDVVLVHPEAPARLTPSSSPYNDSISLDVSLGLPPPYAPPLPGTSIALNPLTVLSPTDEPEPEHDTHSLLPGTSRRSLSPSSSQSSHAEPDHHLASLFQEAWEHDREAGFSLQQRVSLDWERRSAHRLKHSTNSVSLAHRVEVGSIPQGMTQETDLRQITNPHTPNVSEVLVDQIEPQNTTLEPLVSATNLAKVPKSDHNARPLPIPPRSVTPTPSAYVSLFQVSPPVLKSTLPDPVNNGHSGDSAPQEAESVLHAPQPDPPQITPQSQWNISKLLTKVPNSACTKAAAATMERTTHPTVHPLSPNKTTNRPEQEDRPQTSFPNAPDTSHSYTRPDVTESPTFSVPDSVQTPGVSGVTYSIGTATNVPFAETKPPPPPPPPPPIRRRAVSQRSPPSSFRPVSPSLGRSRSPIQDSSSIIETTTSPSPLMIGKSSVLERVGVFETMSRKRRAPPPPPPRRRRSPISDKDPQAEMPLAPSSMALSAQLQSVTISPFSSEQDQSTGNFATFNQTMSPFIHDTREPPQSSADALSSIQTFRAPTIPPSLFAPTAWSLDQNNSNHLNGDMVPSNNLTDSRPPLPPRPNARPVVPTPVIPNVDSSPSASTSSPPQQAQPYEYTDLDLLIGRLEDSTRNAQGTSYDDLLALSDLIGPAVVATRYGSVDTSRRSMHAAVENLPVGLVEIERRRVTKDGRTKLKLSLMGVMVDRCGVCMTQFKKEELGVLLPCRHAFHSKCVESWLYQTSSCPLCRSSIVLDPNETSR